MKNGRDQAALWLRQAADDFRFARAAVTGRFYAQACFIAQQVAEKAVKAVHYGITGRPIMGHSVHALLAPLRRHLDVDPQLLIEAGQLDQYYVATRYPDALPGIAPSDAFSVEQARAAVRSAGRILRWARKHVRTVR